MRKLTLLFALLTLNVGLWAESVIKYTATEKLNVIDNNFDQPIQSHFFSGGDGYITFDGDVTEIKIQAFKNCTCLISINIPNTINTIGNTAFEGCTGLTTITIPASVATIDNMTFQDCSNLQSVTFGGSACQNRLGRNIFKGVGTAQNPVTLVLPEDWNYANAPANNSTAWYGGYFNSNLYSEDEATDKQNAIDEITAILGEYATSTYLQSLVAEEVQNINSATNKSDIKTNKDAAIAKLGPVIAIYPSIFAEGDDIGYQRAKDEAKTEILGTMAEPCEDCPAVTISNGETTVKLYNPTSVSFEKQSASAED